MTSAGAPFTPATQRQDLGPPTIPGPPSTPTNGRGSPDSLIVPSGFDISVTVSKSRRSPAVNITRVLTDARVFNVAASMLEASGVTNDFEADERGAGITIFALLARGTSLHATSTAGVCTLNPFDEMPNHNGHNVGPVH